MKPAMMIRDILRSSAKRPVTEFYPLERRPAVDRFRGLLHWDPEQCTGCGLCSKDCPADAIELVTMNKADKRFVLHYRADRCTYCGQCAYSCRFDCIRLSNEQWELARNDRTLYDIAYGRPDDVKRFLEAPPEPEPAEATVG